MSRHLLRRQPFPTRMLLSLILMIFLISWDAYFRVSHGEAKAIWIAGQSRVGALTLRASGHIPMPPNTPAAHASSLVSMSKDSPYSLLAFWFAGSKESAPDVGIAVSAFDRRDQSWSKARLVVNRYALSESLGFGVRRLGNPVAWLDSAQRLHLFVVATGVGGWAASRILHLQQQTNTSEFERLAFEPVRVLPLSWFWNTSFLVRTAPMNLADGGAVLPVHFELGIKYPVALRLGPNGEFMGMVRMSQRRHLLQPTLLTLGERHWLALMRDQRSPGHVGAAQTLDGGAHWQDLPDLPLVNPNSSVAGVGLWPGFMVLAHNSTAHSRSHLDLSQSGDGKSWSTLDRLAYGTENEEYSYPALAWTDNSLWVTYTDQRKRIAWQRFANDKN